LCLLPDLMLAGLCAFPSGRIKMFAVPGVARSLGTILAPPLSEPDQICRIPDDPRPLSGYWWSIRESGTQASVTATVEAPAYRAQELHVAAEASAQHCNDFGRGEICFGTISSVSSKSGGGAILKVSRESGPDSIALRQSAGSLTG
jgi:hypothetical protein